MVQGRVPGMEWFLPGGEGESRRRSADMEEFPHWLDQRWGLELQTRVTTMLKEVLKCSETSAVNLFLETLALAVSLSASLDCPALLVMDEILHHLGALNYCNTLDSRNLRWCKVSS